MPILAKTLDELFRAISPEDMYGRTVTVTSGYYYGYRGDIVRHVEDQFTPGTYTVLVRVTSDDGMTFDSWFSPNQLKTTDYPGASYSAIAETGCAVSHELIDYVGFTESFRYCKRCGKAEKDIPARSNRWEY